MEALFEVDLHGKVVERRTGACTRTAGFAIRRVKRIHVRLQGDSVETQVLR